VGTFYENIFLLALLVDGGGGGNCDILNLTVRCAIFNILFEKNQLKITLG